MSRASRRKPPMAIAIFPFLAVFICTMGALIVLLTIEIGQARDDSASLVDPHAVAGAKETAVRPPAAAAPSAEEQQAAADAKWRLDILKQKRNEISERLADRRLELSHLEEHTRRLQNQFDRLSQQADDLKRSVTTQKLDRDAAAQDLSSLQEQIKKAAGELTVAKEKASSARRSFAVVPYDGPSGTHRRPIYIECTSAAVVLQPEGIVLVPQDFEGPMHAGNPFDAALRAIREHLAANGGVDRDHEPYPLFLVRPDGAEAYTAARSAMKSWDSEYGYELIDADMSLAFPPPDRGLGRTVNQVIGEARGRQQLLMAAAPAVYGSGGRFARGGAGGSDGMTGTSDAIGMPTSSLQIVRGAGGGNTGGGQNPGGGSGSGGGPALGAAGGTAGPGSGAGASGIGQPGQPRGVFYGTGGSGSSGAGQEITGSGSSGAGAGANGAASAAAGSSTTGTGAANGTGGAGPTENSASFADSRRQAAGEETAVRRFGMLTAPTAAEAAAANAAPPTEVEKARNRGGVNWALPKAARMSIPLSRPVRAACYADKLVLIPERASGEYPTEFPLDADPRVAVNGFIASLWKQMDGWGLAGANMYWKPILRVEVMPGGQERYAQLARLLEGSGISIEAVQP